MQADGRSLEGKVAFITGASRGIGAAAAKKLAHLGAKVIVNYHQNKEAAAKVLAEIQEAGGSGIIFQADVIACLEKAVQNGFGHREWFENDSDLDPLRGDERFQALMKR